MIKKAISVVLVLIISFLHNQVKAEFKNSLRTNISNNKTKEVLQICWKGKLNSTTNVFLQYQIEDDLIVGKITYLDTKKKTAITIIGTMDKDKNYRLLEFDKTGNITGIITGIQDNKTFKGLWYSPKTKKELTVNLIKVDTVLDAENMKTDIANIAGEYHYQYAEAGYQGNMIINKINKNDISFTITSATSAPARNIANIETDTVKAKTDFTYKVPDTDSCEFRIRFFKDFAYINYTKGYCTETFGLNATIEGIYFKTK